MGAHHFSKISAQIRSAIVSVTLATPPFLGGPHGFVNLAGREYRILGIS